MTLLELTKDNNLRSWRTQGALERFFTEQPKFKDAVIVQEGLIKNNFDADYDFTDAWVVELKGRWYNVLFSESEYGWGRGRKCVRGIKFKRFYRENEPKIVKKVKSRYSYDYVKTSQSVVKEAGIDKKGDCQIWTVAKCLNITYKESYDLLYEKGWREDRQRNEWLNDWKGIFESRGLSFETYFSKWMQNHQKPFKGSVIGNIINKLPKTGIFVIGTKNHISCVVDGVIYDSCFEARNHVLTVYKVESITQTTI